MKTKKLTIKIAKTILVFYWICLITLWPLAPLLVGPVYAAEVTLDYNDISVDGYVFLGDSGYIFYSRDTAGTSITNGYFSPMPPDYSINRGYIDWNTTDIPDGSTISSVSLIINVSTAYGAGDTVDIKQMDNASTSYTDTNLYSYIASETTVYVDNSSDFQSTGSKTISLGSTAASDLQNQLGTDWFSISFYGSDETTNRTLFSSENNATEDNRPKLLVNYTEGGGGPVPEFTTTGMLIAVFGSLAGYVFLQRQWNLAEERRRLLRR